MKNFNKIPLVVFIAILASCSRSESCEYINTNIKECTPTCENVDDFENYDKGSIGNWENLDEEGIDIVALNNSMVLHLTDDQNNSIVYNNLDFPKNLNGSGCNLNFDAQFRGISSTIDAKFENVIYIYQGTSPTSSVATAVFKLNASNQLVSGDPMKNIKIPLELASGSTLPSNAFGQWELVGQSNPITPADILTFNALIQNISGIYFNLDVPNSFENQLWLDNFCLEQCCP